MKTKNLLIILVIIALSLSSYVFAMLNPSAVYCNSLGYTYDTEDGTCTLPDNSKVDAWKFLQGMVATNYSYCSKAGYEIKTVNDSNTCAEFGIETCSVCILPNGSEIEVTELMNLSFAEGSCGDGRCTIGETFKNCPSDCPSGSMDGYCDSVNDGICDPDCRQNQDPDCNNTMEENESFCGDGICDANENYLKCSFDCHSGGKDGYCDAVKDGICDPDCLLGVDSDCTSANNQTTTPNASASGCGNGICESTETYYSCPQDCHSGGRDGYCDGVRDGICDPDCRKSQDPDCAAPPHKEETNNTTKILLAAIFGVIFIFIVLFIIIRMKMESGK